MGRPISVEGPGLGLASLFSSPRPRQPDVIPGTSRPVNIALPKPGPGSEKPERVNGQPLDESTRLLRLIFGSLLLCLAGPVRSDPSVAGVCFLTSLVRFTVSSFASAICDHRQGPLFCRSPLGKGLGRLPFLSRRRLLDITKRLSRAASGRMHLRPCGAAERPAPGPPIGVVVGGRADRVGDWRFNLLLNIPVRVRN